MKVHSCKILRNMKTFALNDEWYFQVTLSGFRSGKFMTLVATNVAARGLDINDVQLIIQVCHRSLSSPPLPWLYSFYVIYGVLPMLQCEPPRDVEAYIHRSGRTGRAGEFLLCDIGTCFFPLPILFCVSLLVFILYRKNWCCCYAL